MLARQQLSYVQKKYFLLCIVTIVCLLISDIVFWPSMVDQMQGGYARGRVFDERAVPQLRVAAPMMILHISVSFVFLHFNVKFVSSSRNYKEMKEGQSGNSMNLRTNPISSIPKQDTENEVSAPGSEQNSSSTDQKLLPCTIINLRSIIHQSVVPTDEMLRGLLQDSKSSEANQRPNL
jgi:hypothetical protein